MATVRPEVSACRWPVCGSGSRHGRCQPGLPGSRCRFRVTVSPLTIARAPSWPRSHRTLQPGPSNTSRMRCGIAPGWTTGDWSARTSPTAPRSTPRRSNAPSAMPTAPSPSRCARAAIIRSASGTSSLASTPTWAAASTATWSSTPADTRRSRHGSDRRPCSRARYRRPRRWGSARDRWPSTRWAAATPACRSRTRARCRPTAIRRATVRSRPASRAARSSAACRRVPANAPTARCSWSAAPPASSARTRCTSATRGSRRSRRSRTSRSWSPRLAGRSAAPDAAGHDAPRAAFDAFTELRVYVVRDVDAPLLREMVDRAVRPHGADRVRASRSLPARAARRNRRPGHAVDAPTPYARRSPGGGGSAPRLGQRHRADADYPSAGRHLALDLVEPAHPPDDAGSRLEHVAGGRRAGKLEAAECRHAQRQRLARRPRRCRSPGRRSAPAARRARSPGRPARPENGRRRTSRRRRSDAGKRP